MVVANAVLIRYGITLWSSHSIWTKGIDFTVLSLADIDQKICNYISIFICINKAKRTDQSDHSIPITKHKLLKLLAYCVQFPCS